MANRDEPWYEKYGDSIRSVWKAILIAIAIALGILILGHIQSPSDSGQYYDNPARGAQ